MESLLYGQYNKVFNDIKTKISKNNDLVKFLYYRKSDLNVYDKEKFPITSEIVKDVRKNNIKTYSITDIGKENCYVMARFGENIRSDRRGKSDEDYVSYNVYIYLCVSETLISCMNGDRLLALEQCISDIFTDRDKDIDRSFNCNIGNSGIDKTVDGYQCRVIPLKLTYFNSSRYGDNQW